MSKWEKLLQQILRLSNDLRFEDLEKVLKMYGFTMTNPSGGSSHYTFRKPGYIAITIPKHKPVKKYYVELVKNVIEKEMKENENS